MHKTGGRRERRETEGEEGRETVRPGIILLSGVLDTLYSGDRVSH